VAAAGCNNNFSVFQIGSRTQWNIDSSTYLGVDVAYLGLKTADSGLIATAGLGAQVAGVPRTISDQHAWIGQFRIHRNFYP
jgi:hypothetical protein